MDNTRLLSALRHCALESADNPAACDSCPLGPDFCLYATLDHTLPEMLAVCESRLDPAALSDLRLSVSLCLAGLNDYDHEEDHCGACAFSSVCDRLAPVPLMEEMYRLLSSGGVYETEEKA